MNLEKLRRRLDKVNKVLAMIEPEPGEDRPKVSRNAHYYEQEQIKLIEQINQFENVQTN